MNFYDLPNIFDYVYIWRLCWPREYRSWVILRTDGRTNKQTSTHTHTHGWSQYQLCLYTEVRSSGDIVVIMRIPTGELWTVTPWVLSVCLSVTRQYRIETTKHRQALSPWDSSSIL